ncbi:hypothetical protein PBRA_001426 [Plasmodiophora brassicae]|nr:hypothetical protein PBRA_001426 [Plasmodiophora brassicae]
MSLVRFGRRLSSASARRGFATMFNIDAGLSAEETEFQKIALDFAAKEIAPHAAEWDEKKFFPKETLQKCAQLGFAGVFVDSEVGGSGLSRLEGSIIFEALATGCPATSAYLTIHNMCLWMIDQFGSDEQRKSLLPGLCSMDQFISYCLTEPGSGSDAQSLSTSAKRQGDSIILNGTKAFISGGGSSDFYLVMAREETDQISCFLVPRDAPGVSFGAQERKLGWNCQPTCAVILEDAEIPATNMVGPSGDGFKIAMQALDGGRVNIASCSLGGAQCALNHTLDHVRVRSQFGKTLSMYQNVQFKVADMSTQLHAARLLVRDAARNLDQKTPNRSAVCAMAKRFATDAGFDIIDECLQLHGGYGYLKDYPIEKLLRDTRVHRILEGTNEVMRMIIARKVLQE